MVQTGIHWPYVFRVARSRNASAAAADGANVREGLIADIRDSPEWVESGRSRWHNPEMRELWTDGYTLDELYAAQERYRLRFPPDLIELLLDRRPVDASSQPVYQLTAVTMSDAEASPSRPIAGSNLAFRSISPQLAWSKLFDPLEISTAQSLTRPSGLMRRRMKTLPPSPFRRASIG
jgi:hypothetical protein